MSENIFANEWVECLEAHYMHVIRINDKVTEPSLSIVMHSAGFTDAKLAELRVRATMHIDSVGADFVPDLDVLEATDHQHEAAQVAEPVVYNIPIDLAPVAVDVQPPAEVVPANEPIDTLPEATVIVEPVEADGSSVEDLLVNETEDELLEPEFEAATIEEDEPPVEDEPPMPDPDAPQQLSLF